MKTISTFIPEVKILEPKIYKDSRGYFFESWIDNFFKKNVENVNFVQDNHSVSSTGVLRGIHYQIAYPQGKLVRVVYGRVLDIAVDLRRDSPTFGKHISIELSAKNKKMLWIPRFFGHAFMSLSNNSTLLYKCTEEYKPRYDRCIRYDDPDIGIQWPETKKLVVSEKDLNGKYLKEAELF